MPRNPAPDPAAGPPSGRAAQATPGGPAVPGPPPGAAGGTTPHLAPATPTQPVSGEAIRPRGSRERAAGGMIPSPVTGAPLPSLGTAPARGRTQAPVTALDEQPASGPAVTGPPRTPAGTGTGGAGTGPAGSAVPAGATPLSGEEWRQAAKAELSSQGRERRRRAHRYVPVAKRTAYRPGMGVRNPRRPEGGDAA